MSKPRRNKALAVLAGRLAAAEQNLATAYAGVQQWQAVVSELKAARETTEKAYERKAAGVPRPRKKDKQAAVAALVPGVIVA